MKITLKPIDRSNYNECIALRTGEGQERFVAPNICSLVQAAYEPDLFPLAIYRDETMVGFLLYDFDWEVGGWSMSRLMVDARWQKQGIGSLALEQFLLYFRRKHGELPLYTSAEVENAAAISLYEKAGFARRETFSYEMDGVTYTEVRMLRLLQSGPAQ